MEGNRFHDPETPPPLELNLLPARSNSLRRQPSQQETQVPGHGIGSNNTVDPFEPSIEVQDEEKTVGGEQSYTDHALELVETITRQDRRQEPSKRSVLSNLLKLDLLDHQRRFDQPSKRARARRLRPTHHLRSIASSRSLLGYLSKQSPETQSSSSLDQVLVENRAAEEDTVTSAAQRLYITAEIADIIQRQDFIIRLGKSLVRTGAPSHRIEAAMEKTSKRLEVDGSYIVMPGLIMVNFGDPETHTSETHLIRCNRSLDIAKLEKVNEVAHKVSCGEMYLTEALSKLDDIKDSPTTWNVYYTLLGYTMSSATVAPLFFKGSWTDCWVSAIAGFLVGIVTFVGEKVPMFGNVNEMVVSIVVAVVSISLRDYVCFTAVSLSAIVIALPGYSLTSAVMELSAKNIVSGAIHLVHAIMYVLFLGFGLGYGSSIWAISHGNVAVPTTDTCMNPVSPWWYFLLLPLAMISVAIVFGARPQQWPVMIASGSVGFVVNYFLTSTIDASSLGTTIVPSVGAFALGLAGNLYQRITRRLAFVPLIGGIIILVPGSIGVRGAIQFFDGSSGSNGGGAFAIQIIGIAFSITLGLFLSNLCVYPTGRKRSVFLGF